MCGITGYISLDKNILSEKEFAHFNHSLNHRGPDWSQQSLTKRGWIGHTKLSITDTSKSSNQPFKYRTEEGILYRMVFNGEIYNFKQIREQLKTLGHTFSTQSDTEVVIKSFAEWGEKCQYKFNGIWAMAIYNEANGEVFLSRDRFGVKPLAIWIKREAIFFASEIKSFRKLPPKYQLPASDQALLFLSKRPDNLSHLNKELSHLPAGHSLRFTANNQATLKRWWQPVKPTIRDKSYSELTEEFKSIFFDALKLRIQDPSPKCTALSGGLDSSSVFCATQQMIENHEIKTNNTHKAFSLDYSNTPNSELKFALEVIKKTQSDHTLIRLSPDSTAITPELIRDCIYSSEQINHLFLGPFLLYRAMSQEGYKVSVDGHGADELLAGYKKFARASIEDCIKRSSSDADLIEIKKLWINAGVSPKEIAAIEQKLISLDKANQTNNALQEKSFDEFHHKTLPWILDTYDKIPMAHNIEVRSPFLDWRLVEYCFSLPNKAKAGGGFTKRILRDAMKNIIPDAVRTRHSKQGFAPPMQNYLKNKNIQAFILDTINSTLYLDSAVFDGYKNRKTIEELVKNNKSQALANTNLWTTFQATIFLDTLQKST